MSPVRRDPQPVECPLQGLTIIRGFWPRKVVYLRHTGSIPHVWMSLDGVTGDALRSVFAASDKAPYVNFAPVDFAGLAAPEAAKAADVLRQASSAA